jgi:hypothetical protein
MIRFNKRGIMQAITDILLAIIVLLIGFFLINLITDQKKEDNINKSAAFMTLAQYENNIALYLKNPVEVNGEKMTMADLILLAAENEGSYGDMWEAYSQSFFDDIIMKVEIKAYPGESTSAALDKTFTSVLWSQFQETLASYDSTATKFLKVAIKIFSGSEKSLSIVYLPSHSGKPIKVEFRCYHS